MSPRQGGCPGAIPGNRTNLITICDLRLTSSRTGCASARGEVSKTLLTPGGTEATRHLVNQKNQKFVRGRGRQAMHLLCKQVDVRALPTDSTILSREE